MINFDFANVPNNTSVVVYHTGALGDLLVATAAIFEIINLFPSAEITIIGSPLWNEIILPLNWPHIKKIITTNKKFDSLKLYKADEQGLNWIYVKEEKSLKNLLAKYTIAIDLRSESLRFAYKALLSKVPYRVGASKNKFAAIFFTHFTLLNKITIVHERDRYLSILSSLNKGYIEKRTLFWQKQGLPALKWFPKNKFENNLRKIILINPTASIREKAWDSSRFRELALKLKDDFSDIKIIGSPKETEWLMEVAQKDFQILQPQNIIELVDIVYNSHLLITNTSSMQFIAAGTATPTLTLMGSASPLRWGCLGEGSQCIKNMECVEQIKKFSFSKNKVAKENEKIAYNHIQVSMVLEKVNEVLVN